MRINRFFQLSILFSFVLLFISCGESRIKLTQQANQSLESGQLDSAKLLYKKVVDMQPESPDAIEGLLSVATISNMTEEMVYWSHELLQYRPWHREANLVVGRSLIENGNLKDASIRLMLAYQNSVFKNEKSEVEELFKEIIIDTQEKYSMKQEIKNDSTQQ